MHLLADENVPLPVVEELRRRGHDVEWIRESAPGLADEAVLEHALRAERILLTHDRDFGELVYARGYSASCGVILVRSVLATPQETAEWISRILASRGDWENHFTVVERNRIRIRDLP